MLQPQVSSPPTGAASPSSTVPLKDVSVRELSVVLENLCFSSLVEPFQKNGVSGNMINRMKSYERIVSIGNGRIDELVAETFYEDFVKQWQSSGGIPRALLQPPSSSATPNTVPLSMNILGYCQYINILSHCYRVAGPISIPCTPSLARW